GWPATGQLLVEYTEAVAITIPAYLPTKQWRVFKLAESSRKWRFKGICLVGTVKTDTHAGSSLASSYNGHDGREPPLCATGAWGLRVGVRFARPNWVRAGDGIPKTPTTAPL